MDKRKQGRPRKPDDKKAKAVTFTLAQWLIEHHGGMDKIREKARNYFSKI